MEKIIYEIDNWTIVKLLGGVVVIIIACLAFISKVLLVKLEKSIAHSYDKKIQLLAGDIDKNNNLLSSIVQNYFSSSQKILDKKIVAYELLWASILDIRSNVPSIVLLLHQLMSDKEFESAGAFKKLDENPKIGPLIKSYDREKEISKMVQDSELLKHKPYFSDYTFKLFYTYRALLGRVSHSFLWEYEKGQIYQWKKDASLKPILEIVISKEELDYIYGLQLDSLPNAIDLLEHKILQDFKSNLNIKETTDDSISYLKDIEKILGATR